MSRGGVSGGLPATRWWPGEAGALVKAEREARALTRTDLARLLDVPPARITAWESGRSGPSGDRLNALAEALGLVVGDDLPAHPDPAPQPGRRGAAVGGPTGLDCGPSDDRAARLAEFAARWAARDA